MSEIPPYRFTAEQINRIYPQLIHRGSCMVRMTLGKKDGSISVEVLDPPDWDNAAVPAAKQTTPEQTG